MNILVHRQVVDNGGSVDSVPSPIKKPKDEPSEKTKAEPGLNTSTDSGRYLFVVDIEIVFVIFTFYNLPTFSSHPELGF